MKNNNKEFPNSVFPIEVTNYIEAFAKSQGFSINLMYATFLSLISVLIGNKIKVNIKKTWKEVPMLWVVLVANSGDKKSPVLKSVLFPLQEIENKNYEEYVLMSKNDNSYRQPNQLIVDDVTLESLNEILGNNPNGVLMRKDEFYNIINEDKRYSGGGMIEKYLSIFSSEPIRVNRKGTGQNLLITSPFLSMIGGIQPKVIPKLFNDNRGDNGFIYRILFTTTGEHIPYPPKFNFNDELSNKYKDYINSFHRQMSEIINAKELNLTEDAFKYFNDWLSSFIYVQELDERLRQYKSKLEGYVLRFSIILETCYSVSDNKEIKNISLKAMENSIKIAEYYFETFKEVLSMSNNKGDNFSLYNRVIELFKEKIEIKEISIKLINEGYRVSDVSKLLGIPRTTLSTYKNG